MQYKRWNKIRLLSAAACAQNEQAFEMADKN